MALPSKVTNLHGTLTLASSTSTGGGYVDPTGELNIPIGTTVANSAALQSANVSVPGTNVSCIALVQLTSGTAVLTLDTTSNGTTPTFASANKSQVTVTHGEPVFVGPVVTAAATSTDVNGVITTNAVQNVVALKIQNNSGTTLTVNQLALLSLVVFGNRMVWHDDKTCINAVAASDLKDTQTTGTIVFNT